VQEREEEEGVARRILDQVQLIQDQVNSHLGQQLVAIFNFVRFFIGFFKVNGTGSIRVDNIPHKHQHNFIFSRYSRKIFIWLFNV
jgi:hypothetical protein